MAEPGIETPRFLLRPLTVDDATERYAGWMTEDAARRFITYARTGQGLDDLREFIARRAGRDDVLFLGIFLREDGLHIGNIKFEPLDAAAGYAVMGMLIGDPAWRGRGVAAEVLEATAQWLHAHLGIDELVLGVARDNAAAIRAYARAGFRVEPSSRVHVAPAVNVAMVKRWAPPA